MGKFFVEKRFQYILIILMGLLVYSKTLFFGFTYLDDARLILDDQVFLSKASNILSVFRQDVLGGPFSSGIYYRPLLTLSLMLDAHLGGESAFIYHLTNMALHILTSCLVLLLLTKLGYEKGKSLFFSLLFTVHPVLTQAVAWIPGRNDILLTLFTLISFISLMDFIDKGGAVGYIWHILFFVLAIFTKETALFFPPVCLAYLVFIKKIRMGSFRIKVPALGWAAVIFLWFVVRHLCLPNQMKITLSYIFRNIAINSPAAVQLIGKIIFPVDLSVLPIMRDTTFIYGIAAVILITAALAVSKRARYHYLIFGLSWFALFLLPAFIRPNATIAADFLEHRLYLPIIGFIIILMETDLVKDFKIRSAKGAFIIYAILLIFSVKAFYHADNFKNRTVFWQSAVKTSPHSIAAHMNMAHVYCQDGFYDKAEKEFALAVTLAPAKASSYNDIGLIYMESKMLPEAEEAFKKAMSIDPYFEGAKNNLAAVYFKEGKLKELESLIGERPARKL